MKLTDTVESLQVSNSNISGSRFEDVDISDSEFSNAKSQRLKLRDIDMSNSLICDTNPQSHCFDNRRLRQRENRALPNRPRPTPPQPIPRGLSLKPQHDRD